jgi:hypothetical protein
LRKPEYAINRIRFRDELSTATAAGSSNLLRKGLAIQNLLEWVWFRT